MFKINETIINNLAAKINAKEVKANKVTSLSSSSTDAQYPSAKTVYDALQNIIENIDDISSIQFLTYNTSTRTQIYISDYIIRYSMTCDYFTENNKYDNCFVVFEVPADYSISNLDFMAIEISSENLNAPLRCIVSNPFSSYTKDIIRSGVICGVLSYESSNQMAYQYEMRCKQINIVENDYYNLKNRPTIPTKTSDLQNDSGFLTSHQDITGKEDKSNKVTALSSSSTDIQYPSAKAVYNALSEVIAAGGGAYIDDYYFDDTTKEIVLEYTNNGSGGSGGSGSSVDIVTEWEQTLSDEKVPSEKLVKNTIDTKANSSDIPTKTSELQNDSGFLTEHQSLSNYIQKSGTTGLIKNDGSIMTSGTSSTNYSAGNHTHSDYVSATKVTSWQSTTSDSNVPSEKLVKDTLDTKLDTSIGSASGRILTTTTNGVIQTSTSISDSKVSAQHTYQYLDNTVLTQSDFNIDVDVALKNISDSIGTAIQYINQ